MQRLTRNLVLLSAALATTAPLRLAAQNAAAPVAAASAAPATQPATPEPMYTAGPPADQPALTAFAPPVAAQPSGNTPERRGPATTQISFNFENASVSAVLTHLSEAAGYVILNEVGALDFRVNILSVHPISPEEAVTLLNTELNGHGYTAIRMGRILKITTIDKAKKGDIPVRFGDDPDEVADTDELITQVIPVRSIDAVKLKQDLQPLIDTSAADITSNGGSNSIIITDTSASIKRIVAIISQLDKKDAMDATITVKQLKYADATQAATLITTIFKPPDQANQGSNNLPGGGRFRFGFGGFGRGGFGGGGPGGGDQTADEKGNTGTVVAAADSRTNTVVVTGPPDTLKVINEMLTQLDSNPAEQQDFFLYPVKNGQAVDMQATLNSLFGGPSTSTNTNRSSFSSSSVGSSSFGSSFGGSGNNSGRGGSGGFGGGGGGFGGSGSSPFGNSSSTSTNRGNSSGFGGSSSLASLAGGNSSSTAAQLIGQVFVVADQDTNSLLVATNTKYEAQVRQIIQQLDRPVAQVLIKCLIAEVTHDNTDDLGLDFSVLNTRVNSAGTTTGGQTVTSSLGNAAAQTANGGLAVSLLESNVTATLHALAVNNKIDVLSRPYILASDNQQATMTVGQVVPYISESRLDENDNTINTVTYADVGIILTVQAHINPDGLVTMNVQPQISDEAATSVQISNGVTSPVFDLRSAQTYVAIRDGQTIVIGGLMQDQKTSTITKVPLLGSLPFVGSFFQRNQSERIKTELLIFLTPHAVPNASVLKPMTEDELRGVKLTPSAVAPGIFDEHMRGLQRGTTQPSNEYSPSYDATPPATPGGLRGESQ